MASVYPRVSMPRTSAPTFLVKRTRPSASSRRTASRTGTGETPKSVARRVSTSRVPGA